MNHPVDYLKIAVITWLAVFIGDKVLNAAGLGAFCATCSAKAAASNS